MHVLAIFRYYTDFTTLSSLCNALHVQSWNYHVHEPRQWLIGKKVLGL